MVGITERDAMLCKRQVHIYRFLYSLFYMELRVFESYFISLTCILFLSLIALNIILTFVVATHRGRKKHSDFLGRYFRTRHMIYFLFLSMYILSK